MGYSWHFGNTTVRNPARISEGLKALYDSPYHGNLDSKEKEIGFATLLNELSIVNLKDATSDISSIGRKWRSCFHQLGFITYKQSSLDDSVIDEVILRGGFTELDARNSFKLTPNGMRLITSDSVSVQQEAMLRSLLAYELPSIVEKSYDFDTFKPFVLILQVIKELEQRGLEGLNKFETCIVTSFNSHQDVSNIVDKINTYRKNRSHYKGNKKKFDQQYLDLLYPNETETKRGTISKDYTDLITRYSRFTGLFQISGSRLVLNENKKDLIDLILQIEPNLLSGVSPTNYLINLWNGSALPTDNDIVQRHETARYLGLVGRGNEIASLSLLSDDQIRVLGYELEEEYSKLREIEFAQRQKYEINDILNYLIKLDNPRAVVDVNIYDRPAFLEWTIWRVFLAINSLVNKPYESRRFKVDHEFLPVGCAPGGGPDLIFEFEEYLLVVEVTLTSSSRQEAAEGESVRRHVAKIQLEKSELRKPVYGLFIAQSIDNNTAEVFRIGVWYNGDETNFLNIVPLTIQQLISILSQSNGQAIDHMKIKGIIDSCLIPRNTYAPTWKNEIQKIINCQ